MSSGSRMCPLGCRRPFAVHKVGRPKIRLSPALSEVRCDRADPVDSNFPSSGARSGLNSYYRNSSVATRFLVASNDVAATKSLIAPAVLLYHTAFIRYN